MNRTIALVVATATLGAGLALGFLAAPHGTAHADTVTGYDAHAFEVGDDNADGRIDEDESGWDCATMGNGVCGPDVTYCPKDGVWSDTWHWCGDGPDPGPSNAYDAGAYLGGYN
jgi:hypothetical protein